MTPIPPYSKATGARKAGKEGTYTAGAAGLATWIVTMGRTGGWLPWGVDMDAAAAGVIAGALFSAVKWLRNLASEKTKAKKARATHELLEKGIRCE